MQVSRRTLLAVVPPLVTLSGRARAADDAETSERGVGSPDAPVTVSEFYSLTCPHCAAFARETLPRVLTGLVYPGKVRLVFWDFPLDQTALTAAMVARALPPERYEPFTAALMASQDRWAFARGVNSTEELAKMAALAGLPRPAFNRAIADTALKNWILERQEFAQKTYGINSTPSFVFNGPRAKNHRESGDMSYNSFARAVTAAAG